MTLHSPDNLVRQWVEQWGRTYNALDGAHAYFELASIIAARWEFLGGLYLGNVDGSDNSEAIAYVARFIEPIQPRYKALHDATGRGEVGSDFFTMFRNKPLHGMTPAPSALQGDAELVGWWIGTGDGIKPSEHLTIDGRGNINVNVGLMRDEMLASMNAFAAYLEDNADTKDGRLPGARLQRSFWFRLKPRHFKSDWMKVGNARGIPA